MVMGGGAFHCLPLAPPNSGGTLYASATSAPTVSPGSIAIALSFSIIVVAGHVAPSSLYHPVWVPHLLCPRTRGQGDVPHTFCAVADGRPPNGLRLSPTIISLHAASHALILRIRRVRLIVVEEASWAKDRP